MQDLIRGGCGVDDVRKWSDKILEDVGGKAAWVRLFDALRNDKRFSKPGEKKGERLSEKYPQGMNAAARQAKLAKKDQEFQDNFK